jgi:uncharacterized protein (TIGR01777 family)
MKIIIPGGTGQIGTVLARAFLAEGHDVVILSRQVSAAPWRTVAWDARTLGPWTSEFEGADVIINLAGRSVNCRYTPENRRAIIDSRVLSTRVVGEAIARARRPPPLWLQASSATVYSHRYDAPNDDETGILAGNEPSQPETWLFSLDVARQWEKAIDDAATPRTRKVKLRTSIVLNPDPGSAFEVLLNLVRRGLGGRSGDGRQFVSWIHDQDLVRAIRFLIEHESMEGPVIIAAPNPLPNADFMRGLREAWGISFGLPASGWILELGALFMRTETELILKSRRVVPSRLLREGFTFKFPAWPEAARDLCARWRAGRAAP